MHKKLNLNRLIACFLLIFLTNISFKVWGSDLLKDLDVDWTIRDDPAYKIVTPLPVLVVEQVDSETIDTQDKLQKFANGKDDSDNRHAFLVFSRILERYIFPCRIHLVLNDLNKQDTLSNKDNWNRIFQKELMPFINCSFAPFFEVQQVDNLSNDKCFIECALENNKVLIFGSGNRAQRSSKFLEGLHLSGDQKRKLIFVGALDKMQKPSLYSAIPGEGEVQFIWAKGCAFANQEFQEVGTSLAAPRVTGTLCRLTGMHPSLTDQEALEITFLTATKACFYSTGDQDLDQYLYGPYGALDSMAAFQFAAGFVAAKQAVKELTPQNFYETSKRENVGFQPPKTLRDRLNLIAFLEQHYDEMDNDDAKIKVFSALQRIAKQIDLEELYSQSPDFFIPDDLYAFKILMTRTQGGHFENFIKRTFKENVRSSQGMSILHHVVHFNNFGLVKYYTEILPTLVNDLVGGDRISPLHVATYTKNINLSIVHFLLERGASIYIEESLDQPLKIILQVLSTLKESDNQTNDCKKAALLFLQHKDYDHQKFFPEEGETLEEYTQSLKLDEKYPEFYQLFVGKKKPE